MKLANRILFLVSSSVAGAAFGISAWAQTQNLPMQATQALVEQKIQLVERLLGESPAATRIRASSNDEAKAAFEQARLRFEAARPLARNGDFPGANLALNDAMWLIGKARQLVPDSMARVLEQRTQANAYRFAVDSMIPSYETHLIRAKGLPRGVKASDETLNKVRAMLDEARAFENAERIADANRLLQQAERIMMSGLASLLRTSTIAYAQQFETQAEEYAFELERNRSYVDLIPLAISELKPPRDALAQIDQYTAQNTQAVQRAAKLAAQKNYKEGIAALRGGTAYLQGALAVTGLALPSDSTAQ